MKEKHKIIKVPLQFTLMDSSEMPEGFVPWSAGQRGRQSFLKLKKDEEVAYFHAGKGSVFSADVNKALMKLGNEGWKVEGHVDISFDGRQESQQEILFERELLSLELGKNLLPLVDPYHGAQLLEKLSGLREEISRDTGVVMPGIKVKDNMNLQPDCYLLKIKESPAAMGDIYLDRLIAIGSLEQLGLIEGWSTIEPAYRMNAKWIEPSLKKKAEEGGNLVSGPLNVLITHLSEVLRANVKYIFGLQETFYLFNSIADSFPVLAIDLMKERNKLRCVKKILKNLLAERVSIRDIITIAEVLNDHYEGLEKIDYVTEYVRMALSRQICWQYLDAEGKLGVVSLDHKWEEKLNSSLKESDRGVLLKVEFKDAENLISSIGKTVKELPAPTVLIVPPSIRIYLKRLLERVFPNLAVLSTMEISPEIRLEVRGRVEWKAESPDTEPSGFWRKKDKGGRND